MLELVINNIFAPFADQIKQIRVGGLKVLGKKLYLFLLTVLALPVVLLIRLCRPFCVVRLRGLNSSRIGALYYLDWYLAEKTVGKHGHGHIDFFYFIPRFGSVANHQLVKMYKRVLPLSRGGEFAGAVDRINRLLPGHEAHFIPTKQAFPLYGIPFDDAPLKLTLDREEPFIAFTPKEESKGREALRDLGVPDGKPFICFFARDNAYLEQVAPDRNWDHHDFRDSDIRNYIPAAEQMVDRGHYAVRMGAVVKEKLADPRPGIIDYATSGRRTEFLDVYLGAKCRFFISTDVGISIISEVFRRPIVYVNWVVVGQMALYAHNGLTIFKKFYLPQEKRFLTFREIMGSRMGFMNKDEDYRERGIELIENSPQEIADVVLEMDERLKGTWRPEPGDEERQRKFWDICGLGHLDYLKSRIGAEYLRQNRELLD